MNVKASFKTVVLSTLLLACGMNLSAENKSHLIYNSTEVNGLRVNKTVYKAEGNTLTNFLKYNYKYDEQNRVSEREIMKWNQATQNWENDMCIRFAYEGKTITTTYYKWNTRKGQYVLIPEKTVVMDNTNL